MAIGLPGAPALGTTKGAQTIIVMALVSTGVVASIKNIAGAPNVAPIQTILVGVFIGGALLLAISYVLPEFASGLAVVALLTTVLTQNATPFWTAIAKAVGTTVPSTTSNTQAQANANAQGGQSPSEPGGALNNPAAQGPSLYGPLGSYGAIDPSFQYPFS